MPDFDNWRSEASTRREFIRAGAAGSVILLAGCSGDDGTPTPGDGDGDGNGGGGDGDGNDGGGGGGGGDGGDGMSGVSDERFRLFDHADAAPPERHLNPWNPAQTGCWWPGAAIMDRPAAYSPSADEIINVMIEDWEMTDDTTLEATFRDDYTWHNGDQFVAQDYVMEQQIELEILKAQAEDGENAHVAMESIEAVDDQLVRVNLHTPYAPKFAMQNTIADYHGNLARGVFTKHDDDQWSDWHGRLRDSSGDELTAVIEEITTSNYPKINGDNAIGHGPFQIKNVGDNIIVCELYEDHPNAENINFREFAMRNFPNTNQPVQPYSNDQVDATAGGFPVQDDLKAQLPDTHSLYREARSANSLFTFNCGANNDYDTPVNDRNVRKAICHVFDRQSVDPLLQGVKRRFEWAPCRVPGRIMELGEHESTEWVQDFELYGQNDTERAAEYLRRSDFEQDSNGNWLTPDGEQFELEFLNATERVDFQVLQQNLENFGISVTQNSVDSATFDERRQNGEYEMIPDGSSANGITAMWAPGLVVDWLSSLAQFSLDQTIPMPIGDPEGENGTKDINVAEHIQSWQTTGDSQYHKELMWWWNQHVPEHENMYEPDAGAFNTANWELNADSAITEGIDDALFIATKVGDGISYTGN
ncbi:ABC transporter substrate-binding protein [Halosimplex salinum]|uniref:ABC transporter substrate-binding protein n=1 Tax=Halosimplex salinum TaxID=1710538 RepID=UPI001F32206C|nr:ABC transporter substrate-binding protein [Halosimplex salinum]